MRPAIVIPLLVGLLATPAAAEDRPCPTLDCRTNENCMREKPKPKACQLFPTTQSPVKGPFVMERWQISNRQTEEIPHEGLLIVHVCAGSLTVDIGSARQEWREGTFWSVPENVPLIVHTARDAAVLHTVDIILP
jgi:hypothetical protein